MSKKKQRPLLSSLLCLILVVLVVCAGSLSAAAESLSELQDQQDSLQAQKDEIDSQLEILKDDTDQKKQYRDMLYRQIDTVQQQLDALRKEIDGLNKRIYDTETAIAEKQANIDQNFDLLKQRIRALYVAGEASTLSMILSTNSLMELTHTSEIIKAVTERDQKLIALLTEQMETIEKELKQIQADKEDVSEKKKTLDSKSAELGKLYEEANQFVADAENAEANAQANSEILGSQMAENEEAIKELEDSIRDQQGSGNLGGSGYVGSGNFVWPMPGYTYLTCYFGDGGHRGIDVAGGDIYGKSIVAADGGTVTYAGWNDSYGYCVFIDHGNGYETRYAHMSALGTDTGAVVSQSQVIGYVGSTGNSTGPHLHFEVIYQEGLTDPMGYF